MISSSQLITSGANSFTDWYLSNKLSVPTNHLKKSYQILIDKRNILIAQAVNQTPTNGLLFQDDIICT